MTWVPGYWSEIEGGFQWTAGYWQQVDTQEVEYLPEPPQSLENGPNVPQPGDNYFWIPGTYVWHEARYRWQPGYWSGFHQGWVWVPARYHWTPTGYVYTAGYWDVPLEVRGVMFAPVYFTAVRPVNYYYTPAIVLNIGAITTHLFCRPHHHAYVFGDYYEDRYVRAGFTPWFEFGRTRYGYDPNFTYYNSYYRRSNPRWAMTLRSNYDYIRREPSYRPPRTYVQQTNIVQNITNVNTTVTNTMVNNVTINNISNNTVGRIGSVNMATPLNKAVQQNAFTNLKMTRIDDNNRRQIQTVALKTREASQERRQLEQGQLKQLQQSGVAATSKGGAVQIKQPVKVKLDPKIVTNLNAGASKIRPDATARASQGAVGRTDDQKGGQIDPGKVGAGERPGGVSGRPVRPGEKSEGVVKRPGMQGDKTGATTGDNTGVSGRPVRPGEKSEGVVKRPGGQGDKSGAVDQPGARGKGTGTATGIDPRTGQPFSGSRPPGVGSTTGSTGAMKTPPNRDLPPGRGIGSQGAGQGNTDKGNLVPGAGGTRPPIRRPPPPPDKEKEKEKQKGRTADLDGDAKRAPLRGQPNPQGFDDSRRGYPSPDQVGNEAAKQAQAAAQQKAAQMKAAQDTQARAKAAQDNQNRAKAAQDAQARAKAAQDAQDRAKAAQDKQAAEARAKAARDAQQRQQQLQQQERMKQAQKQKEEEEEKKKRGKGN